MTELGKPAPAGGGSLDATVKPISTQRAILNTIKGSSGNLVEWYDVYIYTVFAAYFENQFFDSNDKNSTIYVYGIFAVTFIMRPIGSWFFGRLLLTRSDTTCPRALTPLSVLPHLA